MTEAWRDPLALVVLIAYQEYLHILFGSDDDAPRPIPRRAAPALAAWRATGRWAGPGDGHAPRPRGFGRGCRLADDGALAAPFRDRAGHMRGLRLFGADGRHLDIGAVETVGHWHAVDPGGVLAAARPDGPVVLTADYADAVAAHDAVRVPAIATGSGATLVAEVRELRRRHPRVRPILAVRPGDDPGPRSDNDDPPVADAPDGVSARVWRDVLAEAAGDRVWTLWRSCGAWATPGNAPWLKRAGLRGYGVKRAPDGRVAVPLRGDGGRLDNLMLIDAEGRAETVLPPNPDARNRHTIDPERRFGSGPVAVAADYADAAAVHRAVRVPAVVSESPDLWAETAIRLRRRHPHMPIVAVPPPDAAATDRERVRAAGAALVAPKRAGRFATYAEGGERPAAVLVDIGQAPYAFKPNNKPSPYARLRDPDGRERHVWGVGLPEAVREAGVAPGDGVVLRILRRETVEVDEPCVDARGRPATRKKRVARNVWRAERRPDPARSPSLEALRDELAEAVGDRAWTAWRAAEPIPRDAATPFDDARRDADGRILLALRDASRRLGGVCALNGGAILRSGPAGTLLHMIGWPKRPPRAVVVADTPSAAVLARRRTKLPAVWAADGIAPALAALGRRWPDAVLTVAVAADRAYAARIAARAAGAEITILPPDGGQALEKTPDPSPERRGRGPKPSPTP